MATNGMTINGLNPLSALTADDKIPVWDTGASGEPTKEITAQNMANSVKSLANLPNTTEMNTAIAQSTANLVVIDFFESDTITVAANGNASTTIYPSKTGYTAVAIAGISSFTSAFMLAEFNISNAGIISIAGHNIANAQISGKITVRVLFVRNT